MHTLINMITALVVSGLQLGCSAPAAKDSPSSANNTKKPITTAEPQPCVGTVANNFCKPATELTGAEKCWAKILGTEAATKCAAEGKVFNRITGVCISDAEMTIKAPCTEEQVRSAFQAAGFPLTGPSSIGTSITEVKESIVKRIKTTDGTTPDPEFANANVEVTLDQCGETKVTSGNNTGAVVLIPFYFGKAFSGGADGFGTYKIGAGKICDKTTIGACTKSSLDIPKNSGGAASPVDC